MKFPTQKKVSRFTLPFVLGAMFLTNAANAVTIIDLGSIGGQDTDYGEGTNVSEDGSTIVGYSYNGTTGHAFKYIYGTGPSAGMVDLGALGTNPSGANPSNFSQPRVISVVGSVIVGYSNNGTNVHAFKYTDGTGILDLGALGTNPSNYSNPTAISADGSVIVGFSDNDRTQHAFKYTDGTGMVDLGALGTNPGGANPSNQSNATAISANGNVIAGSSYNGTAWRAFKYTDGTGPGTGMVAIGALGTDLSNYSYANAISADGTVITGNSFNGTTDRGYKYTDGTGMVDIGALGTNPSNPSYVNAISANGSVIVGYSYDGSVSHAFKYTDGTGPGTGMIDLGAMGTNPSNYSAAQSVSGDGGVIVGNGYNDRAYRAFKYTDSTGMVDLGALGTNPSNYSHVNAMSADGGVIVGYAENDAGRERAVMWADSRGVVDVADWMSSITGANSVSAMSNNLEMTFVEGAHHRTLMSYDNMGKQNQVWATGDFGSSSRTTDSNITTGELGASTTLSAGLVGGLAIGYGAQNTDLQFGGSAAIKGNFILGELDYLLPDQQSIFSILVAYGRWNADTVRGYTVGGPTPDYSIGTTDTTTSTVRLRIDGQSQAITEGLSLTPFASLNWTQTKADAYTEVDGAYPAQFDAQSHTASEGRIGVTLAYKWNENTKFLASAELIHRFDDKATILTGTDITGAMPFATSSAAPVTNQGRFGFDIDRRLDADTLLNFSVHFAGLGASPDVQGALSLRRAF